MVWVVIIGVVGFVIYKFSSDLGKDRGELRVQSLNEKFKTVVACINESAFEGRGKVTEIDFRSFNLYEKHSNQIVIFFYSTGNLNIEWRYKYYQKEVIHSRDFPGSRNLGVHQQERLAEIMINEMYQIVQNHIEMYNRQYL